MKFADYEEMVEAAEAVGIARSQFITVIGQAAKEYLQFYQKRLTERALDQQYDEQRVAMLVLVNQFLAAEPRPLTADDYLNRRAHWLFAWAVATKVRLQPGQS